MPVQVAKDKWDALAQRTKAIILAVISLATIVTTVWVIDARYAKAGEFKSLQQEIYVERVMGQIAAVEHRKAHTDCRRQENRDLCDWLQQRLDYWQKQLRRLEQRK